MDTKTRSPIPTNALNVPGNRVNGCPCTPDLAKAMIEQRARDDAVEFVAIIQSKAALDTLR